MKLVVATTNQGKLREIRNILDELNIEVIGLNDHPEWVPAEEDGTSFSENACKKACSIAKQSGEWCLADDSGLVVDALDGAPGIYSARFAHAEATDAENNAYLLEKMKDIPATERSAAFVCVMAVCSPDAQSTTFEGRLAGEILFSLQGDGGFGYDPLFKLPGRGESLAEISLQEKNSISHRGRALEQVVMFLKQLV